MMQSYRRGSFPCAVAEVGSTAPSTGSNFFQCQRSKEWKCVATISKLGVYSSGAVVRGELRAKRRAETIVTNGTSSACKPCEKMSRLQIKFNFSKFGSDSGSKNETVV